MTDQPPPPDIPMVVRVPPEPPIGERVPLPRPRRPRPGLLDGALLTIGFAIVLFGTIIVLVLAAFAWVAVTTGPDGLKATAGANDKSVASLPHFVAEVLAWSFPIAYAVGLAYALGVLWFVVGRGWAAQAGLARFPIAHFMLGLLALPGFIIVSDMLAKLLFWVFEMPPPDQPGELGDLFRPFHWSFAVIAVGICPGVVEELWCRGFLGRGFIGRYGWAGGILLTSLAFGMLHLYPVPYVLVTAVMGVGLHFTYAMSRSLWVPITIHVLNNSFAALVAVDAIPTGRMEQSLTDSPALVVSLALALLVFAGLGMWTARGRVEVNPTDPVPIRGVMVPAGTGGIKDTRPKLLLVVAAAVCSGSLLWLLFG